MDVRTGRLVSFNPRTRRTLPSAQTARESKRSRDALAFMHNCKRALRALNLLNFLLPPPAATPAGECVSSDDLTVAAVASVSGMDDHELLYSLVDVLVRSKFLADPAGRDESERVALSEYAKRSFGIVDVDGVFEKFVHVMVAARAVEALRLRASSDSQQSRQLQRCVSARDALRAELRAATEAWQPEGDRAERAQRAAALLLNNISALEDDLRDKLSFVASAADERAVLDAHARRGWAVVVTVISFAVAAAAALLSLPGA
jgi:hypothetical protein